MTEPRAAVAAVHTANTSSAPAATAYTAWVTGSADLPRIVTTATSTPRGTSVKPSATQSMVRINRVVLREVPEPSDDAASARCAPHPKPRSPRADRCPAQRRRPFEPGGHTRASATPRLPPCPMGSGSRHPRRARRGPVGRRRCIRPDHRASRGHRGRPGGAGRAWSSAGWPLPAPLVASATAGEGDIMALVAGPTGMVIGGLLWPPPRVVRAPATGSSAALRVSPAT